MSRAVPPSPYWLCHWLHGCIYRRADYPCLLSLPLIYPHGHPLPSKPEDGFLFPFRHFAGIVIPTAFLVAKENHGAGPTSLARKPEAFVFSSTSVLRHFLWLHLRSSPRARVGWRSNREWNKGMGRTVSSEAGRQAARAFQKRLALCLCFAVALGGKRLQGSF